MDSQIWAFAGVAALLTITPGADTALVIRNALASGRQPALSALGLSLILQQSARAFALVQWAGALYLIWLGIQSLRKAPTASPVDSDASQDPGRGFLNGLLTNLLNPKVALFYLTFLPQFVTTAGDPLRQSVALALIHVAMGMAWLGLIAVSVDRMSRALSGNRLRQALETLTGAVLIALGVRLAFSRR
jgi:threonine/homoserine/homoserine lactone efflux protein